MAIKHWDEESINALYRQYQKSRDGIDYGRYQPIVEAAREMLGQTQPRIDETELQQKLDPILEAARNLYLEEDRSEVVDWSSTGDRIKARGLLNELKSALSAGLSQLFDSINPARWVPIAVTAALIVAIVPVVLKDPDERNLSDMMVTQTQVLKQYGDIVGAQVGGLNESQYGFSSSNSEYARAFNSGVLFIDLIGVSSLDDQPVLQQTYESLKSNIGETVNFASADAVGWPQRATEIGNILQAYYSQDEYSSVFVLGQWVESNFLLSKIAQKTGDTSELKVSLTSMGQVTELVQKSGHTSPQLEKHFARLAQIDGGDELDNTALRKLSNILLAIRSSQAQR
ncbi:MAG: hypothetical protein ACR2QW_18185 [bacterium]